MSNNIIQGLKKSTAVSSVIERIPSDNPVSVARIVMKHEGI
jgi:hypothetical protein